MTMLFDKIEDVRSLAQIIVETVREPLLVLDNSLTILVASSSFHKSFQINPKDTTNHPLFALDDGAWDDGVVLRDEVRAPSFAILGKGALGVSVSPLAFVDYGFGRDEATGQSVNTASIGFGAAIAVGTSALATLDLAAPLTNARTTHAGDVHLDARLTLAY